MTTLAVATLLLTLLVLGARRSPSGLREPGAPVGPRSVVVTGSYGAGHDAAARGVVRALRARGRRVEEIDIVDAYPWGTGRVLRRLYFAQLTACPRTWEWVLGALSSTSASGRLLGRVIRAALETLPKRWLLRRLGPEVELVVSTHPFASAALAGMRRRGELAATVATYLTDPSVHPLWVHAGVDVHLAIYEEAMRQARQLGASGVTLVQPLTAATTTIAPDARLDLLARLGISGDLPVALVVGGSEGVGDLQESAADVARSGLATAVVVCGRNEALREHIGRVAGAVGLPWQDDLGALIAAADVVVQNAGGFTALEALAVGAPVVSYRCIPGHGATNARALELERLAPWPRSTGAFVDALTDAFLADRIAPTTWAARPTVAEALGLDGDLLRHAHARVAIEGVVA